MPFPPVPPCTQASSARAQQLAEQEREADARTFAAIERCRAKGVPGQLLDLCAVDGVEKVADWLQVCVLEIGRGR